MSISLPVSVVLCERNILQSLRLDFFFDNKMGQIGIDEDKY